AEDGIRDLTVTGVQTCALPIFNLYLAGGFCLLYAAYLVAEPYWPAWMGRRVFQICDAAGGAAALSAALVVLAAVPAAFQYGLWRSEERRVGKGGGSGWVGGQGQ